MGVYIIWTVVVFIAYLAIRWPYFKLPISADSGFYVSNATILNKKIDFSKGWNANYAFGSKWLVEYFYSLIYLWFGNKKYKAYSRLFFSFFNYLTGITVGFCAFYFVQESLTAYLVGLTVYCLISSEPHYGVYFESGDQFEPLFQALGTLFLIIGTSVANEYLIMLGIFCWLANAVLVKISALLPAIIVTIGVLIVNRTHFATLAPLIAIDMFAGTLIYLWILSRSTLGLMIRLRAVFGHEIVESQTIDGKENLLFRFTPFLRCLQKTKQTLIIMAVNPIIPCLAIFGLVLTMKTVNPILLTVLICFAAVLAKFYISLTPIWYYNIPFLPYVSIFAAQAVVSMLSNVNQGTLIILALLVIWFIRNILFVKFKAVDRLASYVWHFQVKNRGVDSYRSDCAAVGIEKIISADKTMLLYGHNELYVLTGRSYAIPFNTAMGYIADLEPAWVEKLHRQMLVAPPDYIADTFGICDIMAIKNNLGLNYQQVKTFGENNQITLYRLIDRRNDDFATNLNFASLKTTQKHAPATLDCPMCQSRNIKKLFTDHNRRDGIECAGTYSQCLICQHVFLSDRPTWLAIEHFYSTVNQGCTVNERTNNLDNRPPSLIKKTLRRLRFRPHSWPLASANEQRNRLLDLGCGTGTKLLEFSERGYQIWGVDISPEAIEIARKILPRAKFFVSELDSVDLPNDYFDFIRIDNTLEHVDDPERLIARCSQLLRRSGELMIYVPHGQSFSMRVFKGNSVSSWIPFHLNLFSTKSLADLLRKNNFSQVRIRGYCPLTWLPISIVQSGFGSIQRSKWLNILCYPFGWLFCRIGMAEELVGIGTKND
ncbi:hypothetical protein A2482_00730 [Candidatus Falkowbacteria bacterium RIFOXYC2_FULL_48_21]|uniref:Methyltransferase domain-containing protein n=1 Tax=Candidatus Falkowbacteria bacterium RIFOXYC2_FULL_48_21 TaxID=1798005 RepID=A0A1F5T5T0_9BACT|nr:MAG: hypothetical protein A2482_00730 [Candidatus Falkowbacteria bacterium RIFOXYC2_FULL_48_21]